VQRSSLRPLAIALLVVVVLAVASATLSSPVDTGPSGPGIGPGGGPDSGSWAPFHLNFSSSSPANTSGGGGSPFGLSNICIPFLRTTTFAVLAWGALLLLAAVLYRRAGLLGAVAGVFLVFPFGVIVYSFLTDCGPHGPMGGGFGFGFGHVTNATSATGGGGGATATSTPVGLLVALGLVALVLLVAAYRATGDDTVEAAEDEPAEPDDVDLAAVGEAAGEAADRLEGETDFENEVFHAWREMTTHLDVPRPQSSTPGEFQAAATAAGMDPEHVSTLTSLFEAVRYGDAEPTPAREKRAIQALRAIEDAYAEDEP